MERNFTINIFTGDAAFEENPDHATEEVLAQVKSMIIGVKPLGKLYDYNGNCVGEVTYQ